MVNSPGSKPKIETSDDTINKIMKDDPLSIDSYAVWSVSHDEALLDVREKLAVISLDKLQEEVTKEKITDEILVLSTCNRFEIYSFGLMHEEALALIVSNLSGISGIPWKKYVGVKAIEHSFKVASGLTSMALGETQIHGQLKDAYTLWSEKKTIGKFLHSLMQFTFKVAKRVRDKTSISKEGVSIGSIAVKLTSEVLGDLSDKKILMLGSGEQAEITLMHLHGAGAKSVVVANRTLSRAAEVAARFGAVAAPLSELVTFLKDADLIIGSLKVDSPVIDATILRSIKTRRPRVLVDLGVPRNFSVSVTGVADTYLFSIDDLSSLAKSGSAKREEAASDADIVVEYGVIKFKEWFKKVLLQDSILTLREKIKEIVGEAVQDQKELASISEKISFEVLKILKASSDHETSESDAEYSDTLLPIFIERFFRS